MAGICVASVIACGGDQGAETSDGASAADTSAAGGTAATSSASGTGGSDSTDETSAGTAAGGTSQIADDPTQADDAAQQTNDGDLTADETSGTATDDGSPATDNGSASTTDDATPTTDDELDTADDSTDPDATGGDVDYPMPTTPPPNEDGSRLWLRYPQVSLPARLAEYQAAFSEVIDDAGSATSGVAATELVRGLSGLLGREVQLGAGSPTAGAVIVGTAQSDLVGTLGLDLASLGPDGYLVEPAQLDGQDVTVVAANSDVGALYGSFALLRHLQSHLPLESLSLRSAPAIQHRILNHWDNPDGSIERGYAGGSLWKWDALPGGSDARYEDYARANASLGINGAVLNNVNADARILNDDSLDKVAALADIFRTYGIRVYLTARFSAPIEIGGQSTADPLDSGVQQWWTDKVNDIYERIPDFGGFLVKANSEGQPGPQDYDRSHADGANMLGDALAPHGGLVMWRAFVYSDSSPVDRIRQAYEEFNPLDGRFVDNVMVQAKNGPLDFQPREPFSPLFGGMPNTPLVLELQITKEYLGQDTHLVYLGPLYEEVLRAETAASNGDSSVARVIDGSLHGYSTTAIAGVSNVGDDVNWTGSHFNQANWYVFGRMAWDPDAGAEAIAEEWVRQTFSNDPAVVVPVTELMMQSRQAAVDYMTPLGLVHIMGTDHHYGPAPWVENLDRAEWNPVYYHKADMHGLGFDRTATGSNAVEQYHEPVRDLFSSRDTVPDDFLLFFHHVGWNETLGSGRTLWEELVHRYSVGVDSVADMRDAWNEVQPWIDEARFTEVADYLEIQHYEARWWRDACLTYFQQFSGADIPDGYAAPANPLDFYRGLEDQCPADRDKPRCTPVYTGEPSPAVTSAP